MRWWVWRGSWRLPGSPNGVPGRAGASASSSSRPGRDTTSSPWVARVQVTASRPNAELNSSSSDAPVSGWIATVIPFVWPCQESTVDATRSCSVRSCFSRSRSTASVGVVDGLVARREDRDEWVGRIVAGRPALDVAVGRAGVVVARLLEREPGGEQLVEQALDELGQRQVDVGASASARPSTSSSTGTPVATCAHTVDAAPGIFDERHRPVAGRGDAVEVAPLRVERAPQRQLGAPPAARRPAARPTRSAARRRNLVGHAR